MLNEGVHIPDVKGVILLRPTVSPIIFYQQIGRALQVGNRHSPIIFDLVNNFANVRGIEFFDSMKKEKNKEELLRKRYSLPVYQFNLTIYDETLDTIQLFKKLEGELKKTWDIRYEELKQYHEINGNCLVPVKYKENPDFGIWVSSQRYLRKRGDLSNDRIEKLNRLNFDWNPGDIDWGKSYSDLASYKMQHGNTSVAANSTEHKKLANWIRTQRKKYTLGKLTEEQIDKLNELDFVWEPMAVEWNKRFEELKTYKKEFGDCLVPRRYGSSGLGSWVGTQRARYISGILEAEKIEKLNSIGFVWDHLVTTWDIRYEELKEFQKEFGHCRVPEGYEKNPKLSTWVGVQRRNHRKNTLELDKFEKLNALGFDWDPLNTAWNQRYEEILRTMKEHNMSELDRSILSKELSDWLTEQRKAYKKGKLKPERIAKLKLLVIDWIK